MEENDLILTPQRTWHHHENPSDEPVIWLDAIDTPFVRNLNAIFYEQYSSMKQPVVDAATACSWTRAGPGRDGAAWMPKEVWRWPTSGRPPTIN